MTTPGVVDFENINAIKKKSVRGLLRKRAKQYDSDSGRDSDPEDPKNDHPNAYHGSASKRG